MESMQQQSADNTQGVGSNKVLKITTAVMSIIALCGIGFGIYGMIQKNHSVSDLKVRIKNEDGTTTTIETPKIETTTVNGDTTVTITDSNITTENPEDYIYVGEWGLKIKIPEGLDKVSYSLKQYIDGDQKIGTHLVVAGIKGFDGRLPDFANLSKNKDGLGAVTRYLKGSFDDDYPDDEEIGVKVCGDYFGAFVYSDDTYVYCYYNPQDVYSIGDELQGLEVESVTLVNRMLDDSNNYSKI